MQGYERKAKALEKLKRYMEAESAYYKAATLVQTANVDEKTRLNKLAGEIRRMWSFCFLALLFPGILLGWVRFGFCCNGLGPRSRAGFLSVCGLCLFPIRLCC